MIGEILGHYRILEKIGSGGMGEVYRAADDRLARDVAIKVLKPSFAKDPDRLRRFELEARASAALSHPNIVAIYDIGVYDGSPYIVSELLQGETLRQKLARGPLPLRQFSDYGVQVADGLIAAHEKRIVHRDLKPENLFITRDGHVKILDFGIAKLTTSDVFENSTIENLTTQTKAGSVLGTVCYMSPEQLRGKPVDHRSDIFSFGAILYEMVTGVRAFKGETEVDTMMAVLQEDPPEMVLSREAVPIAFNQIVRHCMEKEPDNRFQSARDLAFALSTATDLNTKSTPVIQSSKKPGYKWLPWAAGALLLLIAGLLLGYRFKLHTEPATYTRITFQRGTVFSARFSPNSNSILYGALWNDRPLELYTTVGDSPLARPLGFTSSHLLALSRTNELALIVRGTPDRRTYMDGVLARAPLAGGTPREILENVIYADWSPSGDLAVARLVRGHGQLEYPIGKVLYQTSGWVSDIRFSPDGNLIAFMDHAVAWDDRGPVCIIDLKGHRTVLTSDWKTEAGLAWAPSGKEIWFTADEKTSNFRSLWGVNLKGEKRQILTLPASVTLQDVAPDGRILVTTDIERVAMEWAGKDSKAIRDLSWYDWSVAKDISHDGQWVLFEESSEPAGTEYTVAIRKVDGSPPVRLGEGSVGNLSADGKWAISVGTSTPPQINVMPIGPGEPRHISIPQLESIENGGAYFLPDGKRAIVLGNLPKQAKRTFIVNLSEANPDPRPIGPENNFIFEPSPDGKYLLGDLGKTVARFPLDGSQPIPIPLPPLETSYYAPIQWSPDGKLIYMCIPGQLPQQIFRVEVATGKMSVIRELVPADRAGVERISPVVVSQDGTEFIYSYRQTLSSLYVINGIH